MSARDALALAAEPTAADLVEAAAVGRAPKITGVLIADLLRHGAGAALVVAADDLTGRVWCEADVDLDDPRMIVLLEWREAAAACRPPKPPKSPAGAALPVPIPIRPPVLAQALTERYAEEWAA